MRSLFEKNVNAKSYKEEVKVLLRNSVTFWAKGFMASMLPTESKIETSHGNTKTWINNWFRTKCNCNAFKYVAI